MYLIRLSIIIKSIWAFEKPPHHQNQNLVCLPVTNFSAYDMMTMWLWPLRFDLSAVQGLKQHLCKVWNWCDHTFVFVNYGAFCAWALWYRTWWPSPLTLKWYHVVSDSVQWERCTLYTNLSSHQPKGRVSSSTTKVCTGQTERRNAVCAFLVHRRAT